MSDEPEVPTSWLAGPHRAPVIDAAGARLGVAESYEGEEGKDIFHSVVVKPEGSRGLVEVPAARVTRITTKAVYTDLTAADVASLAPFEGPPPPAIGGSIQV